MKQEERMSAETILTRARNMHMQIEAEQERIMRMRTLAEKATGGLEQWLGASCQDWRSELILKVVDEERQTAKRIEKLIIMQREAQSVIDRISDDRYRTLLQLRYLAGLKWDEVAEKMGYDSRQIYRLHKAAIGFAESVCRDKEKDVIECQ